MSSQDSKETDDQQPPDETKRSPTGDETDSDDHLQRKRSRIRSHPDEESHRQLTTDPSDDLDNNDLPTATSDSTASATRKTNPLTAAIKRRKLHVDLNEVLEPEEKTNDSVQTSTQSNNESRDASSTTTTTTTTDHGDDQVEDDDDDDDYDDDDDEDDEDKHDDENENDDQNTKQEPLPPLTNLHLTLRQRELGIFHRSRGRYTCRALHNDLIGSRGLIQRMKISHTLDGHNGCVNALSFNRPGTLLASASDDLHIILWDWALNEMAATYESDHHSNVFQAKFVPYSEDRKVVSCARDGQVRLAELRSDGSLVRTKKIAQHLASAHKLALDTVTGTDIFSCGEDGVVYHIDLRENKANKLLTVSSETSNKLPLYSIELNRGNPNEFVVAGMDPTIRVFDRRSIDSHTSNPLKNFCPDLLKKIEDRHRQPSVTSAVYNYNGSEILGSYNDEDIYLFDATHSDGADAIRRYRGHRNSNTVKGVNFYGRNSEYVISGSDCGHVFIWDKASEQCVWFDKGDDDGTVNVLEPHPHFPVIATSGLDHDVKIWQPLNDKPVDFTRLKGLMKRNAREREHELHVASALDIDTGGLLRLIRPVFRRIARRANAGAGQTGDDDDDEDDDDDDDDEEDEDNDEEEEDGTRRRRHTYSLDCAPS